MRVSTPPAGSPPPPFPPPPPASRTLDFATIEEHWRDEADAAFLYRVLAEIEPEADRRHVFARLAAVEDRHTAIWAGLLGEHGRPPEPGPPTARARVLAWIGRRFGARALLPILLREEGREVKSYLEMHRATPLDAPGGGEALQLARESAEHASTLAGLTGKAGGGGGGGEPWHRTASGGFLRNVVYGFNDGLTANFGLVAGVLGATATQQHTAIVVAGVAGVIADALSMGSSGYLAAKSEQEVYAHEIAMERDEIAMMPDLERDELALIYEAKGIPREAAESFATNMMRDPEQMLREKVREELGIGDPHMSPLREGWVTGLATAIGALIPVFPFFVASGATAIVLSFTLAMLSHFLVGAARSVFTGRGVVRSGMDMFVVGLGVAIVGYVVGGWVGTLF